MAIPRLRRRRGADEGAVAVEAALIVPVLIVMIFGMIDFGLLIKDDVAVTSAARAISRTASTQAPIGLGQSTLTPTDRLVGQTFFTSIANQAQQATAGLGRVNNATTVYVSLLNGTQTPPTGFSPTCSSDCVILVWNGTSFVPKSGNAGSWTASHVNACVGTTALSKVSIDLVTPHSVIMPIPGVLNSGSTFNLSQTSTLYFEPVPSEPGPCVGS